MSNPISAHSKTYRIATDALFVALYVILSTWLSFKIPGTIQISISTLPILLCAFLFGPSDAVAVALLGTFLEQVIDPSPYGFATLPLWLIPGAIQALIAGFGARQVHKISSKNTALIASVIVIVIAELTLTMLNLGTQYLDGYLMHYPVKAVQLLLPARLLNGGVRCVLSSVLVPLLLPPLKRVLARQA